MRSIIFFTMIFAGCGFVPETEQTHTVPQLVFHTALPPIPAQWLESPRTLEVLFHIGKNGAVTEAKILTAVDTSWGSEALEVMKGWQFSPAKVGDKIVSIWIRVPIRISYTAMKLMTLGQLTCDNRVKADSAYRLLELGWEFEKIARLFSPDVMKVNIDIVREIDIRAYSEPIQKQLMDLREDGFTRPIQIGDSFIIFKRVGKKLTSDVE